MTAAIFTFETTSRVYQAERLLRSASVAVGLRPLPVGLESLCGLCIQLDDQLLAQAWPLLQAKVDIEGAYRKTEHGWEAISQLGDDAY